MHLSSLHDAVLHRFSLGPQAKRLLEAIIAKDKQGLLVRFTLVSVATCCTRQNQHIQGQLVSLEAVAPFVAFNKTAMADARSALSGDRN